MPYRRNDSAVWWVSLKDPSGQRVRRSTETTDKREAQALEAKWKAELHQQRHWEVKPPRTLEEVLLAFLQATTHKRSRADDLRHARRLREVFEGFDMGTFGAKEVRAYIVKRQADGLSNASVNRELALLSAAINHANRELEWALPNPVSGRKLKEPPGRERWLKEEEAHALLAAAEANRQSPHLGDFIRLALHTGMRRGELLQLEWKRVDLSAGLIHLGAEHTKAGKKRSVPLNRQALTALEGRLRFRREHCPESPWVFAHPNGNRVTDVKRSFITACQAAGIENFRIHDLRHTFASWLVSRGVPLGEVRELLGHSTVMVTERYAHLAPERGRAAVAILERPRSRFGHGESKTAYPESR